MFVPLVAILAQQLVAPVDLDRVVRAQADSGFSGVVLVARGDSVVYRSAQGRRRWHSLTTDSRFNIGSMTKGFTAAAILALREQSRLSLDDSLSRFFDDVPPDKRGITIAQLLRHISGLDDRGAAVGARTRDAAVHAILAAPMAHAPGTFYRYMNDDYVLLAAIVEVAAATTWNEYLTRTFLRPLGLEHTGFQGGDWAHRGADGMVSTAPDLLRWIRAIENGLVVDGRMSAELRRPLLLVRREPPLEVYAGYGTRVYVRDRRVVEVMHSGSADAGHTGIARVLENGDVIIVFAQGGTIRGTTWASRVANRISPRR